MPPAFASLTLHYAFTGKAFAFQINKETNPFLRLVNFQKLFSINAM